MKPHDMSDCLFFDKVNLEKGKKQDAVCLRNPLRTNIIPPPRHKEISAHRTKEDIEEEA